VIPGRCPAWPSQQVSLLRAFLSGNPLSFACCGAELSPSPPKELVPDCFRSRRTCRLTGMSRRFLRLLSFLGAITTAGMALGACAQPTSVALRMTQSASDEVTVTAVLDINGYNLETDKNKPVEVPKTLSFYYQDTVDSTEEQKSASLVKISSTTKTLELHNYQASYRLEWTETVPSGEKYEGCLTYNYEAFSSKVGRGSETRSVERCASIEFPDRTTTTTSTTKPGQTTTTSRTTQPIVLVIPTTTSPTTTSPTTTSPTTTSPATTTVPVGPTTTLPGPPACMPGDPPPCP
jgi:hypothetical protein